MSKIPLHTFSFTDTELEVLQEAMNRFAYKLAHDVDDPSQVGTTAKYLVAKRVWEMLHGEE